MEVGIVRCRYGCRQAACATSALIAAAEAAGNCEEQTLRLQQPPTDQSGARPAGTLTLAHTISAPHAILPDRHAQHGRPAFLQVPTYKHVSHETIYRAIYVLPRGELRKELIACLRKGKLHRGPDRRAMSRGWTTDSIPTIHERPLVVEDREQAGHWEGDLIKGAHNRSGIATLVERKSRYLMLLKIKGTNAYDVRKAMEARFKRLPMRAGANKRH